MRDITTEYEKAKSIVEGCGISPQFKIVSVTKLRSNAKKFGECVLHGVGNYAEIKINPILLDENKTSEYALTNTLVHEILHACANYNDGHSGLWKTYADKVSDMTPYRIKRTSSYEEKGFSEDAIKEIIEEEIRKKNRYIIKCNNPDCDCKWGFARMCDKVKHPGFYRCGKCKSALERVI